MAAIDGQLYGCFALSIARLQELGVGGQKLDSSHYDVDSIIESRLRVMKHEAEERAAAEVTATRQREARAPPWRWPLPLPAGSSPPGARSGSSTRARRALSPPAAGRCRTAAVRLPGPALDICTKLQTNCVMGDRLQTKL